jgi:hypothetical protein
VHVLLAAVGLTLFPLAPGTHWTFRDVESGAASSMSVRSRRVLHGFPGAGDLRVRPAGKTVQAWDGRWKDWFRFGAPIKTTYTVALSRTPLWQNVEVRIVSKTATARDYRGKPYRGCTRFAFQVGGVADAGLTGMTFCPRLGPVRYSETTIAGPRTFALTRVQQTQVQ